ncbi:MAG TPA: Shedu anti-phage system protein SduA domain-containing protein [Rhodanobacteraceae bacterium]
MKLAPEYQCPTEFEEFLDSAKGERAICRRIAERSQILYWALCTGGHDRYVFKEFPLGNSYVVDFAVLNSHSGSWQVTFVEFEPIDAKLFTRSGVPSKRLASALKQVDDWAEYFAQHKPQIRADLVRWAKKKDILGYASGNEPCNFSGDRLADPSTSLFDQYCIFIGRRLLSSSEDLRRKSMFQSRHNVEIATYDRLLDLVRQRYRDPYLFVNPA